METPRIIKTIAQRNETKHPKEDQPGDSYIKIPQNQYTDKVVNVNVVIQEQVSPDSNDAQTELEKETR